MLDFICMVLVGLRVTLSKRNLQNDHLLSTMITNTHDMYQKIDGIPLRMIYYNEGTENENGEITQ